MILRSVTPKFFGPFAMPMTLQIEEDVTVLTGGNDTGKTLLLDLIYRMCAGKQEGCLAEGDVTLGRTYEADQPWAQDPELGCEATFAWTNLTHQYIPGAAKEKDTEIRAEFRLAPGGPVRLPYPPVQFLGSITGACRV